MIVSVLLVMAGIPFPAFKALASEDKVIVNVNLVTYDNDEPGKWEPYVVSFGYYEQDLSLLKGGEYWDAGFGGHVGEDGKDPKTREVYDFPLKDGQSAILTMVFMDQDAGGLEVSPVAEAMSAIIAEATRAKTGVPIDFVSVARMVKGFMNKINGDDCWGIATVRVGRSYAGNIYYEFIDQREGMHLWESGPHMPYNQHYYDLRGGKVKGDITYRDQRRGE